MSMIVPKYLDCVVAIGVSNPSNPATISWVGTGFLVGYHDDMMPTNQYLVYIVSNKHVFEGHPSIFLRFNPQGGQPAKEYKLDLVDKAGAKLYKQHPSDKADVAAAMINVNILQRDGIIYSFFALGPESYTIADLNTKGISEGDGVFVLGYPMGLIGTTRQYVILRSGSIARIHDMLAGHSSDFIVDAFVFPGNSGGPVIVKPELASIPGTQNNTSSRLIGLVKSYIPYSDVAISPQTNRARVVFEENTGLTIVEPVDLIIQTIQQP